MLRQALATSSKAARSSLGTATQRSTFINQFRAAPILPNRVVQPAASRWYSADAEAASKSSSEESKDGGDGKPAPENQQAAQVPEAEATLKKELESKTKEAIDWKDKYLRSVADFRNLQDRTQRDMKSARDFAIQKFAKDLVDSVDNLDRALVMVPDEKIKATERSEEVQDLLNLYDGLKMTETVLMQTLKKHGLERFDPNGEKFNPNEHEATFMTPMKDKEHNTVFHTQQKGFKLNGRILRAAKVGVVNNN